jgi:hypothetical protein
MRELLGSNSAGIFYFPFNQSFNMEFFVCTMISMSVCAVCGQQFSDDIRFLNHMMDKHGFRNPNIDKPDRNSRGY